MFKNNFTKSDAKKNNVPSDPVPSFGFVWLTVIY